MATVKTKTLNSLTIGDEIFTQDAKPVEYWRARELERNEHLEVTISPDEHVEAMRKPEATGGKPTTEAAQIEAIKEAIADLDPDQEDNFTSTGLPDARALTKVLGWTVTATLRDKAMGQASEGVMTAREGGKITIVKGSGKPAVEGSGLIDTGADASTEDATEV